jgi:hypothetical protein
LSGTTLTQNIDQVVSAGSVLSTKGLVPRSGASLAVAVFVQRPVARGTDVVRVARFGVGHHPDNRHRNESESLRQTVTSLQERVQALEQQLVPSVIVLREISAEEAKRELLDYFNAHPDSYPSDAAVALRLDSEVVRDLCRELVDQGLLAG